MLRGLAIRDTNSDRRSTLQHKTRHTNAGGGVRCNTRRVTPTPEEEYVATQDASHQRRRRSMSQHKTRDTNAGGGVCRNTRRVTPTPEEEYVAKQDASHQRRRRSRPMWQHKTVTPTPEEEYVATTVN